MRWRDRVPLFGHRHRHAGAERPNRRRQLWHRSADPAGARLGHTGSITVTLRAEQASDLALLQRGDSVFDDFGPRPVRTTVREPRLDEPGGLVVVEDGELAGDVSWHWRQWGPTAGSRCPMIGIWPRPEHRGRGIGRAAQMMLIELFFAHTTTNRVEAHTDVENLAEQRALEAAGLTREGCTRGAQWRDGAYRNGYLYAILREDHRQRHIPS